MIHECITTKFYTISMILQCLPIYASHEAYFCAWCDWRNVRLNFEIQHIRRAHFMHWICIMCIYWREQTQDLNRINDILVWFLWCGAAIFYMNTLIAYIRHTNVFVYIYLCAHCTYSNINVITIQILHLKLSIIYLLMS